jgi:sigma-B regulation protein RsbU (phosphoserine phosphatase)
VNNEPTSSEATGSASVQDMRERLRRIEAVTDVELSKLALEDLLKELLVRVRELLDGDTAAVLLLDEGGQFLTAVAATGLEEEVHQGVRIPLGRGFAGWSPPKRSRS